MAQIKVNLQNFDAENSDDGLGAARERFGLRASSRAWLAGSRGTASRKSPSALPGESGRGLPHSKTLRDSRGHQELRQVLDRASLLALFGPRLLPKRQKTGAGTWRNFQRSKESLLPLSRMDWDLKPKAIPLTRPTDTLSPTGGEGQGEGDTVHGEPLSAFCTCIGTMNPAATATGARTSVRLNAACGINSALREAVRFMESPVCFIQENRPAAFREPSSVNSTSR